MQQACLRATDAAAGPRTHQDGVAAIARSTASTRPTAGAATRRSFSRTPTASASSAGIESAGNSATWRRVPVIDFDRLAPGVALAGIDLAQVENLTLYYTAIGKTPVLHDTPVFVTCRPLSVDCSAGTYPASTKASPRRQGARSPLQAFAEHSPLRINHLRGRPTSKSLLSPASRENWAST